MLEKIKQVVIDDSETFLHYVECHLRICLYAIIISTIVGVTLGIICAKKPRVSSYVINIVNFIRRIPTIALLILFMPILGSGMKPALVALCIICIPVQIINTRLGIMSVEPQVIEAANGMGMGKWRQIFTVEIPLALPMIFTGLRTASIQAISAATIASYVGSTSLGNYIVQGFFGGTSTLHLLLVGAGSIATITVVFDWIMGGAQKWCNRRFGALQ